jgi:hypothetical protein
VCDPGYVAISLSCRPGCMELDCSGNGTCVQSEGELVCACDEGYDSVGQDCRPASTAPAPADGGP